MNTAKLRRSRDVSEPQSSRIKNAFNIRYLAMFKHGFRLQSDRDQSVHQAAELIAKSQLTGRHPTCSHHTYLVGGIPQHAPLAGSSRCDCPPVSVSRSVAKAAPSTQTANQAHQPKTGSKHDAGFIFRSTDGNAPEHASHHSLGWNAGG
jgi:hypothetical protein